MYTPAHALVLGKKISWEDLTRYGTKAIENLRMEWGRYRTFPNIVIAWLTKPIQTDDKNAIITSMVTLEIPKGADLRTTVLALVDKVDAQAILVIHEVESTVNVLLESEQNVTQWNIPIERHGDILVLGREKTSVGGPGLAVIRRLSKGDN